MSYYERHKDFFDRPFRLSQKQQKNPVETFDEFFEDFPLWLCREDLEKWLNVALTSENDEYVRARGRSSVVFFREKLEELIEAAYILKAKRAKRP